MRRLAILGALTLLAGCGLNDALDRMDREADQKRCDGFGFQRGTEAYANCLMQQAAQREAESQQALDRAALERAARKR
ncbi:hypothetical protein [Roseicella sp. DB1501]|uniref:hypothetical protein n=1 Tax=Roseicella sp. DB1501 TaxID=2730925 RepID=UPI001492CCE2|nr:hypothetical protein [Roseicella sp. DB1501]NOG70912.1 hypothetical protein [Roseicella sp. DB1501]